MRIVIAEAAAVATPEQRVADVGRSSTLVG